MKILADIQKIFFKNRDFRRGHPPGFLTGGGGGGGGGVHVPHIPPPPGGDAHGSTFRLCYAEIELGVSHEL